MALRYNEKFLFSGDHLWWNPRAKSLGAPTRLVWRRWVLVESIRRLLDYPFEWLLAGHGDRVKLSADEMRSQLTLLLDRRKGGLSPVT
jgi:glyoxylase-like metal-dependent hydrolase (beta-lactamase superfamily II)